MIPSKSCSFAASHVGEQLQVFHLIYVSNAKRENYEKLEFASNAHQK